MPSKSPEQAKLMRAAAHGWKKPGGGGPSQQVAREFVNADRRSKVDGYQFGGMAMPAMRGALTRGDPRSMPPQPWRGAPPPRAERGPPQRGGFRGRGGRGRMPPGGRVPGMQGPIDTSRMQTMGPQQGGGGQGGALAQMMRQLQNRQGGGGQPGGGGGIRAMMERMQGQRGDPRSMPPQGGGGRSGLMGRMMQQQGRMTPPNKGPRRMVPPSPPRGGFPGGGNPMTGGRNPMMRQARNRYMGASPTRQMR